MTRSYLHLPVALACALVAALVAVACRRPDPPPQAPVTQSSPTPVTVKGTERVAWDQIANSPEQVAGYRFIGYVDDLPTALPDARCETTPTNGHYPCSARLPVMSPGRHRFELAAQEAEGRQQRGLKSGTLILDVQPADTTAK